MVQSREEKSAYNRQNYKDHREERLLYGKQFRLDHPDQLKESKARYYIKNRNKLLEQSKQYNRNNPRDRTEESHRYYMNNRDKLLPRGKQYHKDHPEVNLKSSTKRLTKLGKTFDMDCDTFKYALLGMARIVKKRDGKKCTWCNGTENLIAHHIWHKAFCPESALEPDNGITLCHDCHMEQHRLDRSFN